jgi:hypothetical protein
MACLQAMVVVVLVVIGGINRKIGKKFDLASAKYLFY